LNVAILGIVSLLAKMSAEKIYPLIPLFLVNVLGAAFIDIDLIECVEKHRKDAKIISVFLLDRFGKRKSLVYSG
jgi:hypothetical protein